MGTTASYQALLLANVASYVVIGALTLRCAEPQAPSRVVAGQSSPGGTPRTPSGPSGAPAKAATPWRDRRYLAFTGSEIWLFLDDSILQVGFPLWIVHATDAPVGLAPLVLVLNSVLVIALQVPLSRFGESRAAARRLLVPIGAALLTGAVALAASAGGGPWFATGAVVLAAVAFTLAEILHSIASWELSIALAQRTKRYFLAVVPGDARVDLPGLKALAEGSYVSFASADKAEALAGSVSGTILPFSFHPDLELVVDPGVLEHEEIFFNAARLDRSLALRAEDYRDHLHRVGAVIRPITAPSEPESGPVRQA